MLVSRSGVDAFIFYIWNQTIYVFLLIICLSRLEVLSTNRKHLVYLVLSDPLYLATEWIDNRSKFSSYIYTSKVKKIKTYTQACIYKQR